MAPTASAPDTDTGTDTDAAPGTDDDAGTGRTPWYRWVPIALGVAAAIGYGVALWAMSAEQVAVAITLFILSFVAVVGVAVTSIVGGIAEDRRLLPDYGVADQDRIRLLARTVDLPSDPHLDRGLLAVLARRRATFRTVRVFGYLGIAAFALAAIVLLFLAEPGSALRFGLFSAVILANLAGATRKDAKAGELQEQLIERSGERRSRVG